MCKMENIYFSVGLHSAIKEAEIYIGLVKYNKLYCFYTETKYILMIIRAIRQNTKDNRSCLME